MDWFLYDNGPLHESIKRYLAMHYFRKTFIFDI